MKERLAVEAMAGLTNGATAPRAPGAVSGPLSGIRILEVGHMLAGPYCGLLLADLGAEVIKVEPTEGDIARRIGPHTVGEHNVYFASLNRNKKSVCIDLTTADGRRDFEALAASSHALITNLRPSAILKLGLTYERLKSANPKLVCVALTGYGLDSPMADYPAYDYVIQALTGVMALTGDPSAPPTKTGYSAVDNSAGLAAAVGLLAKIVEGKGGQVDVAMYDVMLSQLNYLAAAWLNAHEPPERQAASAHPYIVPAQLFQTKDNFLCLFITHDAFWRSLAKEVGRPDWVTHPSFATMAARRANRELVVKELQAVLLDDTTANWVQRLRPTGIVVSSVETLTHALADVQTEARRMTVSINTDAGSIRTLGNPIKFGAQDVAPEPPPLLGEHNGLMLESRRPELAEGVGNA